MNTLNTTSVSLAVTPTVVSTLFSHYFNRKPLRQRPTAHLSYDEGLHLIRSFLEYASHHTVEELQAFTAQWVPHPQWVKVEDITVSEGQLTRAAELLQKQLGTDGLRQIGGEKWWQWRKPKSSLDAEWIEMRSDAYTRKQNGGNTRRVMMYVHGGAYFFGSVDEHRYQMQRHARKLQARVFAPRYRLSPQFPFPCGLHDCLAAYLYLLTVQDPTTIVLAGDSAGGGMVMSLLCVLRDQGIPLPAGAVLISPWVDLTHSFPSVSGDAPLDYIPQAGFHHKPSKAWPPPNEDDVAMLREEAWKKKNSQTKKAPGKHELKQKQQAPVVKKEASEASSRSDWINGGVPINPEKLLSLTIDGQLVKLKDQIQMYTTNELLAHPLVSPVMQPSLGGLPPLLIMVGGGEILRDEQIYLAHKCANPAKYAPPEEALTDAGRALLERYKPTDVQLQIWDDLCHVAPTLSFTRPAKYMYRSVAQFSAWALARAQKRGIEILDDDNISVISQSGSESDQVEKTSKPQETDESNASTEAGRVGRAGDPLPPFKNHMIRQKVTRHGEALPLAPEAELPACCIEPSTVGVVKEGTVKKWLAMKKQWDQRFASNKAKIHKKTVSDMVAGYHEYGPGECPPPTALAGRRRVDSEMVEGKRQKSWGLAMWSLWGSKHDEMTVEREKKAGEEPDIQVATSADGQGARTFAEIEGQDRPPMLSSQSHSRTHRKTVIDLNQTGSLPITEDMPVAHLLEQRREKEATKPGLLSPDYAPETGVAGKRPFLDGIALPFSLGKDADTASMMTLQSNGTRLPGSRPMSPNAMDDDSTRPTQLTQMTSQDNDVPTTGVAGKRPFLDGMLPFSLHKESDTASMMTLNSNITPLPGSRPMSPNFWGDDMVQPTKPDDGSKEDGTTKENEQAKEERQSLAGHAPERPALDTFVTAQEELPRAK
ncbi:hypothetical protein FZEAL_5576 [Fusarium zealandicum]|uniref:Alpha/beta hydrolase fold-3 domain-containing protein n=1 Tax=Fusarium zealandicum TaxID=1053134 RepID=A0A8H4UJG5_9HYPO|nr:hypothetical protein FZEAL_5576 [Fusarium zealandicum]